MKRSQQKRSDFPPQIKYIIGNETCERFSYYGMKSILVVFMINQLKFSETNAETVFHLFASACYLLPLLGAFLADRFLGKYKTILYLSLVYCLGHFILSAWESEYGLYVGLGFIALGSGGIKPCVSAYVGDQFTEENRGSIQKVFDLFYWSINFGSFFSTLLIPWTLTRYGSRIAFGIPGVLMGIATLLFLLGRKLYIDPPLIESHPQSGFMKIWLYSLSQIRRKAKGKPLLDVAKNKFSDEKVEEVKTVSSIMKVFFTVSIFWALFDQSSSTWVLQAQKMNLSIFGIPVEAAQMQAINPILVLILIPVFGNWIYPSIERMGIPLTPLRKMSAGMVLAGSSFVIVGLFQSVLDSGVQFSVGWQFLPYFIITCSEIMVSITGLEFAYTQAPATSKSTIMSFWLITVFLGNLLDAYIAQVNIFKGALFFYFFAALMFIVSVLFIFSASRYKLKSSAESSSVALVTA